MVLWRPTGLLELTPRKDVLFIIGDWNAKAGSQETPGERGKFGLGVQNEEQQRLTEFCQRNILVIANTLFQQETLYTWTSPDSQDQSQTLYSLQLKTEKLYTVSKNKTRNCLCLRSWVTYCKIHVWIEKAGKTTRPFRYDLNQIPYDYTVEVMNRFKGLEPSKQEYLKNYGWKFITLYRRQWPKPSQRKRNTRKQSSCLRRLYK